MKNGIKYLTAIAAVAAVTTLSARAGTITVNYGSTDVTPFDSANGVVLPIGDLVEVGAFIGGYNGGSSLSNFTVVATGAIGDGTLPAGFSSDGANISDTVVGHLQIAMVVFNNSTGVGATQEGIFILPFSSAAGNASSWKFPLATDASPSTTIDADDLTATPGTASGALASGVTGFYTGTTAAANGGVELGVIPEPSSIALVVAGLLGLVGISRRRS